MKDEAAARAGALIRRCKVAALGTRHDRGPSVTMVPYAIAREPFAFVVLVSELASHTRDMIDDSRVALMVMQPEGGEASSHALARVSIQGGARALSPDDAAYTAARAAYAARFPDMAMLFELGDFTLFAIVPTEVRVVTGFAQASSLLPETLARAVLGRNGEAAGTHT